MSENPNLQSFSYGCSTVGWEKLVKGTLYKVQLFDVILLNLLIFWLALNTGSIFTGNWSAIFKEWQHALWPGAGGLVTIAMNSFFDHEIKARIIFLRWTDPLPGSRAFSEYVKRDPRIDMVRLEQKIGHFPVEPARQNALWYSLYRTIQSKPEVTNIHKEYLIMRDWACITVLLFLLLMPLAFIMFFSTSTVLTFGAVLV